MLNYIFNTNLYYYEEGTDELCTMRIALTYPWKSPHTRDILRWMCFDHVYTPFSDKHPLTVLKLACSMLSMDLSENAYFFNYEDAVSRDMSKSFHRERYISIYKQKKIADAKRNKSIIKKLEQSGAHLPVHKTKEKCEQLLRREEYLNYLQKHSNVWSREMEFYYCSPKGEICMLRASEWAPIELKSGLWTYKPCIIEGEGNPPSHIEGGEAPDPLHALINSLQSITRYLTTYAEEHGICRYSIDKEGREENTTPENFLDVSNLKIMGNNPVLWGLAFRMEPTGELIIS